MALSESRKRANVNYLKRNPEKRRVYQYRSNAKTFIKKYASMKDLDELETLIYIKKKELKHED